MRTVLAALRAAAELWGERGSLDLLSVSYLNSGWLNAIYIKSIVETKEDDLCDPEKSLLKEIHSELATLSFQANCRGHRTQAPACPTPSSQPKESA